MALLPPKRFWRIRIGLSRFRQFEATRSSSFERSTSPRLFRRRARRSHSRCVGGLFGHSQTSIKRALFTRIVPGAYAEHFRHFFRLSIRPSIIRSSASKERSPTLRTNRTQTRSRRNAPIRDGTRAFPQGHTSFPTSETLILCGSKSRFGADPLPRAPQAVFLGFPRLFSVDPDRQFRAALHAQSPRPN